MDSIALKTESVKVLTVKLEQDKKNVQDVMSEKVVMKTCIIDVNGVLSDIIETREPMITIIVRKHLAEKLRPVFAILHHLEGKDKLFYEEPILDNIDDEEVNEEELKRQKARESEFDENQRIVREAEAKEKAEKESRSTLEIVRGYASQVHELTLAYLLCINPYDWIMLYNLLLRDSQKFEPVIHYLKLMIISYIKEVGTMDVEIAVVLRKKPTAVPKEAPEGFEKLKLGKIYKKS
ncbi:unnamed protein product [Lactuca saligna]|uniref:Uncharacterized protein n=1 Tax=Lactuca saligna TaxID=75948 RepID=A0AA35YMB0_LACSI|nr:unnamed protein product [Lactuca saligna]